MVNLLSMKYIINRYIVFTFLIINSLLMSEEENIFAYTLHQGANLVSFPLEISNNSIDYFFTNNNPSLLANISLENYLISVITEGELAYLNADNWVGSLSEINPQKGYWIVLEEQITFLMVGFDLTTNLFFLHPGANLISYPFPQEQLTEYAIPTLLNNNLVSILGENEALYNNNGSLIGSLNSFTPGKGYWIFVNDYTPFQYNEPSISLAQENNNHNNQQNNIRTVFNQSTLQSVFFIDKIYLSGQINFNTINLNILCNEVIVGNKNWTSEYSDLIAMGIDGFDWTDNYCIPGDEVTIKNSESNEILYILSGDNSWQANDFEIITLSDSQFGDVNFDNSVNISDIVVIIEHLLSINVFNNEHSLLLSDVNKDNETNVIDVIILVDQILED